MEYTLDIYSRQPEQLMELMARNCKARRLEKGYSRRTFSEMTGIPAPTFCKIVVELGYFNEMSVILSKPKFTTGAELEIINRNKKRQKGR